MKKIRNLFVLSILSFVVISCGGPQGEKAQTGDAMDAPETGIDYITYSIIPEESNLRWLGTKPTGEHYGGVDVTEGELRMEDDRIVGGMIVFDMQNISNEDLKDSPEYQEKLVNHLKSADFFNVSEHPRASFEIVSIEPLDAEQSNGNDVTHRVSGNLTIKDISRSIGFPVKVEMQDGKLMAEAPQFLIDRTEWDIRYKSKKFFDDLKDQFIHDDIGISFVVVASGS